MPTMTSGVDVAQTAALIGDPGRANMLALLMDGRAHTASELAQAAGVMPSTASGHLARLEEGRLIAVAQQGRHRYFRLASADIAALLESLMVVAGDTPCPDRLTPRVPDYLREARSCYDHIAGRLGVSLADAFVDRGAVVIEAGAAAITPAGVSLIKDLGFELPAAASPHRPACRLCLDWSQRKFHLAGVLGAALMQRALGAHWIERVDGSRALRTTVQGVETLNAILGTRVVRSVA
jgi:DNA-binding transcriptional ArsR family regulator